ncbi:MAG: lipid-A-disaccharide synthase [Acidobacteria bacterium]|nr:lipid-A-disaccharide synthase [Acidobacteriota bacterium]
MRVLISAGEASGEHYGAQLAIALRARLQQRSEEAEIFGLGGNAMRAAGCETIVDANDIAVVGITEVFASLPRIRREFHRLVHEAERSRPQVAVLIDFPDFNLRLAKQLWRRGIPVVYFISPQLWAWRAGRVKQVRRYARKMLVIFPFEAEWYRQRGVEAEYVGHPLFDERREIPDREAFARRIDLDAAKQWIALLPGSRRKEVSLNLPPILEAAALLEGSGSYEFLLPIAPTLTRNWLAQEIAALRKGARVHLVEDAPVALAHARAAVVASGTATVQAALAVTPFVMVYRVSPSSYVLGRWMVRVPHFAMPNLIAGRCVVPELVQRRFTAENVVSELRKLLPDGRERDRMLQDLKDVRSKLAYPGDEAAGSAIDRAAAAVLEVAAKAVKDKSPT